MRVARPIVLNSEQQVALEHCAALLAAADKKGKEIAAESRITAHKAAGWRNRFLDLSMAELNKDAPRAGRTPLSRRLR